MKKMGMLVAAAVLAMTPGTVLGQEKERVRETQMRQEAAADQAKLEQELRAQSRQMPPKGDEMAPPPGGALAKMSRMSPMPGLGAWWKDSKIASEIGLTPTQATQIEERFQRFRLELIDLRADVEKQEIILQPLVEADQPDEAAVSAQVDRLVTARGKLEKANTMLMVGIRRVLAPQQWRQLQEIQMREMRGRMRMAPPQPPQPLPDEQ